MAIDYRIRFFLELVPLSNLAAARGAACLAEITRTGGGRRPARSFADLAESFGAFVADHNPVGGLLDVQLERELSRYCFVLGLYEAFYRAPVDPGLSPLAALGPQATVAQQLSLVSEETVDDLVALAGGFATTSAARLRRPFVTNPSFAGCPAVGRADGDFIADGLLVDIKTSVRRGCSREWVYQLVGYALLDFDDRYAIRHIGLYASRIPALLEWDLDRLLSQMAGVEVDATALRADFREQVSERRQVSAPPRTIVSRTPTTTRWDPGFTTADDQEQAGQDAPTDATRSKDASSPATFAISTKSDSTQPRTWRSRLLRWFAGDASRH